MSRWGSRAGGDVDDEDYDAGFGGEYEDSGFGEEDYDDQATFSADEGDDFGSLSGPLARRNPASSRAGSSTPSRRAIEAPPSAGSSNTGRRAIGVPPRSGGPHPGRGGASRGGAPAARGGRPALTSAGQGGGAMPNGRRRPAAGAASSDAGSSMAVSRRARAGAGAFDNESRTARSRRTLADDPPMLGRNGGVTWLRRYFREAGRECALDLTGPVDPRMDMMWRYNFRSRANFDAYVAEHMELWGLEGRLGLDHLQVWQMFDMLEEVAETLEEDGFDPRQIYRHQAQLGPAFLAGVREESE